MARISKSPGRTRELNYFSFDDHTHLVDLPGYGYAKVNEDMRQAWAKLIERYLSERQSLRGIFLIMDVRHPMSKFDCMMLEFCQNCGLPVHILLNKADKLSKNAGNKVMASVRKDLVGSDVSIQLFSATKGTGLDGAREKLANWLFSESVN